jgi:hypothetical protein
MTIHTPVAFIIFNRPDTTERVFQAIRQAQPKKLLVIADGPRADRPGEAEKCAAARAVIDQVDWDCEVLKNYSDVNLGCGIRISSGLNWAFSLFESLIILEDDCLPDLSFFQYCQSLLIHYHDDKRIMQIGGNNFQNDHAKITDSYYFSRYNHSWGWATWRRAWEHFDFEMKTWPEFHSSGLMQFVIEGSKEREYWTNIFNRMHAEQDSSVWDYMWMYACWSQSGLSIIPKYNLVSNIGFGADATHTSSNSPLSEMSTQGIEYIQHPKFMIRNHLADTYVGNIFYDNEKTLSEKIMLKLKTIYSVN